MKKPASELQVISRLYDLQVWICQRVLRFPRAYRFTLGSDLQKRFQSLLEGLLRAKYARDGRWELLQEANLQLASPRVRIFASEFVRRGQSRCRAARRTG